MESELLPAVTVLLWANLEPCVLPSEEAGGEPLGSQAAFEVLCDLPGKAAEEVQSSVRDSRRC